jgi:hypothetical protein
MMPYHGSRIEPQSPAFFLQTPTNINVISCYVKLGIETTDGL